jgi:hypothetical protein
MVLERLNIGVDFSGFGHNKSESWWGLFTDSAAHLLSFPTPTHTHDSGNHSNGYGHSKIAFVRSSVDRCSSSFISMALKRLARCSLCPSTWWVTPLNGSLSSRKTTAHYRGLSSIDWCTSGLGHHCATTRSGSWSSSSERRQLLNINPSSWHSTHVTPMSSRSTRLTSSPMACTIR